MYLFFLHFTFNMPAMLYLNLLTCWQYEVGLYFLVHSEDLYFLICVFRPLTFNIIIVILGLNYAILLFVFYLCSCSIFHFSLPTFLWFIEHFFELHVDLCVLFLSASFLYSLFSSYIIPTYLITVYCFHHFTSYIV